MPDTTLARVRSVDTAARTALVELDGSEGTAVTARLSDGVHPQTVAPGAECVVIQSPAGERALVATLGHVPRETALYGASGWSTASPPASVAYTDGVTWQDALTASVRTLGACELWAHGWLGLRGSLQSAASAWELRVSVTGATASPATGWGSAVANLQQVCPLSARIPLPAGDDWTARLQVRVLQASATVTCAGGLLLVETRLA